MPADQRDVSEAYSPPELLPDPLPADPFPIVRAWFDEAHDRRVQPNPNAMTVASVDGDGNPSARVVLCKKLDEGSGHVVFYTNYESRKGRALLDTAKAAAVFHWDALDRQVRIEGPVVKSPEAESDAYFASRPLESRIGAWASDQSRPVGSRQELLDRVSEAMARFKVRVEDIRSNTDVFVPRPAHWGGFRLWAARVELWVGGPGRVHDRACWTRELLPDGGQGSTRGGAWEATRLQP